ncbi:uncharacterized protein [Triticum aestivum]|uniref:uncharacterized protein isoform X2 n=1 Tax=Triticum aestivum TaxID=4565 RepID=UPI001D011FEC|nr:uncharacterized protein LOC123160280 isoform X2 [Triticum aestivum]XP_044434017.1 uncharacterized protein LOC123160280 isoform X2 [Triticum aestivum]
MAGRRRLSRSCSSYSLLAWRAPCLREYPVFLVCHWNSSGSYVTWASLNSKVKATFLRFCAHAQARWFNTHFQMLMPEETRGKYWKNSCNQDEQGFCKREGV